MITEGFEPMDLQEFQKKILEDAEFRKELCDDPRGTLKQLGWDLPDDAIPEKIDHAALEERVQSFRASGFSLKTVSRLDARKINTIGDINRVGALGGPRGGELAAVALVSAFVVL